MHERKTGFITLENLHRCHACWACVRVCPRNALGKAGFFLHRHAIVTDSDACIGCGKCIKACRHGVIAGN